MKVNSAEARMGKCGCYWMQTKKSFPVEGKIVYCQLHKSAPELLSAVEDAILWLEQIYCSERNKKFVAPRLNKLKKSALLDKGE